MSQIPLYSCQSPESCCQGSVSAWLMPVGVSGTPDHLPGRCWLQHMGSHGSQSR